MGSTFVPAASMHRIVGLREPACLRPEGSEESLMIKAVVLVPKRQDISSEEFRRYVEQSHLPLVKRLPGLRRLVMNYVHPNPDDKPPSYEGVGEDWFDSREAMQTAFLSAEGQAVAADVANFSDADRLQILMVEEVEVPLA